MTVVLASTVDMTREQWLELRRNGIGGSDVGAIAGLNKWKSPLGVYFDKVSPPQESDNGNEKMYWGNVLEDVVAKEFEKRSGLKVRRKNQMLQHKDHPFMLANLDRVIVGRKELLECKTAGEYAKAEWEGDEVPASYLLQVMHYLAVTGYEAAWIAVLIGGNHFVFKRIERDDEMIEQIIDIEKHFWEQHVLPQNPPMFDGSEAASELVRAMYPEAKIRDELTLNDEAQQLIEQYMAAKEQMKDYETRLKEAENRLKALIGEHEAARTSSAAITWKNFESTRVDSKLLKEQFPDVYEQVSKTSSSRRFTIKALKEAN